MKLKQNIKRMHKLIKIWFNKLKRSKKKVIYMHNKLNQRLKKMFYLIIKFDLTNSVRAIEE